MKFRTKVDNRKTLINEICSITGKEQKYLGPPTFAYTVGAFTIDREGTVECEDLVVGNELKEVLIIKGFVEEQKDVLEINIPIEGNDFLTLRNLVYLIHSKQYLLNKVVGSESFYVSEELIELLENTPLNTEEKAFTLFSDKDNYQRGFVFGENTVTFIYPTSSNPEKNKAYVELSSQMVIAAKESKRISYKEQKPENEKYYLRIWLVRLGFDGEEKKAVRKALLFGLKGHTAFRTQEDEEKHKARLQSKKVNIKTYEQLCEEGGNPDAN